MRTRSERPRQKRRASLLPWVAVAVLVAVGFLLREVLRPGGSAALLSSILPKSEQIVDEAPKAKTEPRVSRLDSRVEELEREVERLKAEARSRETVGTAESTPDRGESTARNGALFPIAPLSSAEQSATEVAGSKLEGEARKERDLLAEGSEEGRRDALRAALEAAQMSEDRARREVDSIRLRPSNRAEINRSALQSAEAMLRGAEDSTRKARLAFEGHQSRSLEGAPAAGVLWTQQQIRWLFLAIGDLYRLRANIPTLTKAGKNREDAADISHAVERAEELAFEAENQLFGQRPKQAARMADEALRLYNVVANAVGEPGRTVESPEPVEPEEARIEREKREIDERFGRGYWLAGRWNEEKMRNLSRLIAQLPKSTPAEPRKKLLDKSNSLTVPHSVSSGPERDRAVKHAEECLVEYNRLVPAASRKTVRDL